MFESLAADFAAKGFLRCFTRLSFDLGKSSWELRKVLVKTWASVEILSMSLKILQ